MLKENEVMSFLQNIQKECIKSKCSKCDFGVKYGEDGYYCNLGQMLISETPDTWNLD